MYDGHAEIFSHLCSPEFVCMSQQELSTGTFPAAEKFHLTHGLHVYTGMHLKWGPCCAHMQRFPLCVAQTMQCMSRFRIVDYHNLPHARVHTFIAEYSLFVPCAVLAGRSYHCCTPLCSASSLRPSVASCSLWYSVLDTTVRTFPWHPLNLSVPVSSGAKVQTD